MTRLFLLAVLAAPAVGCMGVQPAGPMSKLFGTKSAPADAKAGANDGPPADVKDAAPSVPGRPTPPAVLITPGEVAPENAAAAAAKLEDEIEHDLKNTPPAAKTPIISEYKGGVKIR